MSLEAMVWLLLGFGFGAIVPGVWMRQQWRRQMRDLRVDHIIETAKLLRLIDRATDSAADAQAEIIHWHRLYQQASGVHRIEVTHILPAEPGDEWKRGGAA